MVVIDRNCMSSRRWVHAGLRGFVHWPQVVLGFPAVSDSSGAKAHFRRGAAHERLGKLRAGVLCAVNAILLLTSHINFIC